MNTNEHIPSQKPTMTVQEVAYQLGVGKDSAYAICDGKRFPIKKVGRRVVVIRKSFEKWLYNGETYSVLRMGR